MDINIEDVMVHVEALRAIDRLPFDQLTFFKDGQPITITDEVRERWRYIGLSNTSFVKDFLVENNLTVVVGYGNQEPVRDEDC